MSRVFPFSRRGVLVALLMAASSLLVQAEVTLSMRWMAAATLGGQPQGIGLEAGGECAGRTATVTAYLGEERVFTTRLVLGGPGQVRVTLPPLVVSFSRILVVEASCEGTNAPPLARVLEPSLPGPALPLHDPAEEKYAGQGAFPGGKRARTEGPGDGTGAPPPPGSALVTLPDDLLLEVARFTGPNSFRYVSKRLNRVAQAATDRVVIRGEVTDDELAARLRAHPRVRAIRFEAAPNLTPEGIVRALGPCRWLRDLSLTTGLLPFTHVQRIAADHDRLVCLDLPGMTLRDTEIASLPTRIKKLGVRSVDAGDATISRFQHLESLALAGSSSFTGEHLPVSLMFLHVVECSAFTGRSLPASLTTLEIHRCSAFEGSPALPNVTTLVCIQCTSVTEAGFTAMLWGAPRLSTLAVRSLMPMVGATLGQRWPATLRRIEIVNLANVPETAFEGAKGLESLYISNVETFTGRFLPHSLRKLQVGLCPHFRSSFLGSIPLESLRVGRCTGYANDGLPASLVHLTVLGCQPGHYLRLKDDLPRLRRLQSLEYLGNGDGPLTGGGDPAFGSHPALMRVVYADRCRLQQGNPLRVGVGQVLKEWNRRKPGHPGGMPDAAPPVFPDAAPGGEGNAVADAPDADPEPKAPAPPPPGA
ncbi:hypothetical protein [Mesoterricola silvestris]|uniref:F-box domain-containing protein n=1 Tax=Mesoterricola silvestris TaxID=2927979 RepID=A0AA48GRQ3_9BACT|nr:hypothetical protein [Mesoterricola silvestris]BDU74470.1 hypothetical protein METEAL_36440 [Mesoterricola silvestris]